MKKWFGWSLAAVMISAMVLGGCSSKGDGGDNSGSTGNIGNSGGAEAAVDASKLKPVKLRMFYPCGSGCTSPDFKQVQNEVNNYLKDKINAKLELNGIDWSAWFQKMPLLMQSGEQADLIFTAGWSNYNSDAAKGAFKPLDELIDQYGSDMKAQMNPLYLEVPRVKGKLYAVPVEKEIAGVGMMAMQQDIVDKYKFDYKNLKSMEDMEPMLETIKKNEPGLVPFYVGGDNGSFFTTKEQLANNHRYTNIIGGPGAGKFPVIMFDSKDKKMVNYLETPEYTSMFKLLNKWYKLGYINRDSATQKDALDEAARQGKTWFVFTSSKPDSESDLSASMGRKYVRAEVNGPPVIDTDSVEAAMMAIGRNCKDPERAMMVINLLHKDKHLLNLLNFGIEGKNYEKVSDGVIKLPAGKKNMEEAGYDPGTDWMFGNQFNNFIFDTNNPKKWELYKKYNETAVESPLLGFYFDSTPVKTEVAAVSSVMDEFNKLLLSGSMEPESQIKKYNDKLKANKLDKIIAEAQKQYDEWVASKNK
ncbi:ABC transporter substrate-binding protein (plasmid) [Paenibacillus rhizovicinus]|uniref:ABC transporter substrate-binding protein n=1 Tax=Paenibacillus rhizovicinus TaxID=2704463 RepID=A0A6C0PAB6_9BACL|nr:ABC transporter substrate-binding protein [Paenibacillus rhizovicinus]QHW35514.1 ABC transporter substrate-binding protein [Paenibacillus rhizovicinus]